MKTALVYLAHLNALDEQVKVGRNSRQKLLTLWSNLPTTGKNSLYAQLFLTRSVLKNDPIFDDPMGHYLCYFDDSDKKYKPFRWDAQQPEDPRGHTASHPIRGDASTCQTLRPRDRPQVRSALDIFLTSC